MAITVTLYSFTKRENSTKRPSSGGTDYSCTMIDDTSLMNPTFKLEIAANPIGKNYCYVSDFHRYYFITDIRTYQNFWYIECTCDVLASFKTEIGSQSHYVLRSSSAYDEYISDSHYGAKIVNGSLKVSPPVNLLKWGSSNDHCFIVGITGFLTASNYSQQSGSVVYYAMNDKALYNFIYFLMHDITSWSGIAIGDYDNNVQQALLNPIQYIVSCIGVPLPVSAAASIWTIMNDDLKFGYYDCPNSSIITDNDCKCYRVSLGSTYSEHTFVTIPKHPQAVSRGVYMNGAPYSKYTLHCGPWGDVELDPSRMIDETYLHIKIIYELSTGQGKLILWASNDTSDPTTPDNNILFCSEAQVGAPLQISQATIDPLKSQLSWTNGMNSVWSSGLSSVNPLDWAKTLIGAQNNLNETYADALRNKYPSVNSIGSQGSFMNFFENKWGTYLLYNFYRVVDENLTEFGRPLCQVKQINTLSGFILCENADAQISGTADEATKINAYMNTGFFYE